MKLIVEANEHQRVMRSSHVWLNSGDEDIMATKYNTRDREGGNREPWLLRVEDVAELLGVSRSTVYNLINTKELPSVMIAGCRRIPEDQLRAWVAKQYQ